MVMTIFRNLSAFALGAALSVVPALAWGQQPYPGEDHTAKQDMKNAGHETKNAARDTGEGVKHGTQKAYHSTKQHTKHAWHKTENTTKGAVNGAKEGAHQPE